MDKAGAGDDVMGAYVSSDSTSPYVRFNDYWSRWTDLGVHGDARPATAEKGRSSSRRRSPGWSSWRGVAGLAAGRAPRFPRAAGAESDPVVVTSGTDREKLAMQTSQGRSMRIHDIQAIGLAGATPKGGWSEELRPEYTIHTLVFVPSLRQGHFRTLPTNGSPRH